jgi:hypothetical protein
MIGPRLAPETHEAGEQPGRGVLRGQTQLADLSADSTKSGLPSAQAIHAAGEQPAPEGHLRTGA